MREGATLMGSGEWEQVWRGITAETKKPFGKKF
jgi:hypothetical protein